LGSERRLTAPLLPAGWTWSDDAIPGFHVGAEITHRVIGTQPVSLCWRAPGLSAQIRMRWFPDPSRPKNTTAYLRIGFRQDLPVTEEELRRLEAEVPGLVEPLPEAYESWSAGAAALCANMQTWEALYGEKARALGEMRKHFYTSQKTMTVRVWLDHAHNSYKTIRWVPRELKEKSWTLAKWQTHVLDEEREARIQQLAEGGAPFAWLATRGLPVSRETIYRWIREKKIYATQNKRKRILLDEKALQQAVALVRLYLSRSIGRERGGGSEEDI
jgi:hypothetical protein